MYSRKLAHHNLLTRTGVTVARMDNLDFRKAMLNAGLSAGTTWVMPSVANGSAMSQAVRGGAVSLGTDLVGGMMNYDSSDNLIITSAIAGGLNAAYGRWSGGGGLGGGGSNLTRDFFMGALLHAAAGTIADSLEDGGGVVGVFQHGFNRV